MRSPWPVCLGLGHCRSLSLAFGFSRCLALGTGGVQLGRRYLAELRWHLPDLEKAVGHAEAFTALVRERTLNRLNVWLKHAADGAVQQFQRFAKRLLADYNAARAASALP